VHQNLAAVFSFLAIMISTVGARPGEGSAAPSAKYDARVDASQGAASGCDASLWNHVYSPKRLQQVSPCMSVTGVITESNADADGDQHFLLRLDPGQDKLVNKRNGKKKGGDLVLEIVCANPTSMKKPRSACAGYTNRIPIPRVGARVTATGTYVLDSHNGWTEIHPVSRFEAK
jgi:hypothetical protein